MLVNVDIKKAYDVLEWNAVLATLKFMNFSNIWIAWMQACLSSASFSFLMNGQPTEWYNSYKGICQDDPSSPSLFLLVFQNLAAFLNRAMNLRLIPSFDDRLNKNFHHLMTFG